jgi:hypothetical protein
LSSPHGGRKICSPRRQPWELNENPCEPPRGVTHCYSVMGLVMKFAIPHGSRGGLQISCRSAAEASATRTSSLALPKLRLVTP